MRADPPARIAVNFMTSHLEPEESRAKTACGASTDAVRRARWDRAICALATVLCLAPFLNKAYHIDDPYYLWIAKHIVANPADYYGIELNWYGTPMPVYAMHASPPLAPYVLAAAGALLGWQEPVTHAVYVGFAILFVLSSYAIARRACTRPLLATMLTLATPATLVTSTNVMLDLPMAALFTSGIAVWLWASDSGRTLGWVASGLLIGLAALTKYFGIAAVPLLGAYMLVRRKQVGTWAFSLLIPVIALGAEQFITYLLYEKSTLLNAGNIASESRQLATSPVFLVLLTGLSFVGGCLVPLTMFGVGTAWRRPLPTLALGIVALAAASWVYLAQGALVGGVTWELPPVSAIQLGLFIFGGLYLMTLVVWDWSAHRSPESVLLACWVLGTFVFATLINWGVTARSILPMAPAAALLVTREGDRLASGSRLQRGLESALVGACFAISLAVGWADFKWADSIRQAGRQYSSYRDRVPGTLYFQGHWGFQYYMEEGGAKAVDFQNPRFQAGDVIVIPQNNANVLEMGGDVPVDVRTTAFPAVSWLAVMSMPLGAGFYSDRWGPLPYAFGSVPADTYHAVYIRPSESVSGGSPPANGAP